MQLYNLVMVLNQEQNKILMLYRSKNPYKDLYNLPGGKIEDNEDFLLSAYRELYEETGITDKDIKLQPYIDFTWHQLSMEMKVFFGVLNKEVELVDEIHKLSWHDLNENFFDITKYAGEGNIGHMVEIYKANKDKIN
jgi:8-oxo-dGTP diphosphatase